MTATQELARYAAIFAADAGAESLYYGHRPTFDMAELCVAVAQVAIDRRDAAFAAGRDFYACDFVEAAAFALHNDPAATLEQLLAAGQAESDAIGGE